MALQGLLPGPAEMAVFAMAVLVLNATPGVDFVLTVSRTLQGGARAGFATALGINAGCVVHALAAAFGIDPTELMLSEAEPPQTPLEAVEIGLREFADFSGMATRFEYWWFLALLVYFQSGLKYKICFQI